MKKPVILAIMVCLFALGAAAQSKKVDFSGTWTLDPVKSKIGERAKAESIEMVVTQTAADLKVTTKIKRQAPAPVAVPAAVTPGVNGTPSAGAKASGFDGFAGGDSTVTYGLARETVVETEGPNGRIPVKYKGSIAGTKAILSTSRSYKGPSGDITSTITETWSLSPDGRTLTVVRDEATPRSKNSLTQVFTKK